MAYIYSLALTLTKNIYQNSAFSEPTSVFNAHQVQSSSYMNSSSGPASVFDGYGVANLQTNLTGIASSTSSKNQSAVKEESCVTYIEKDIISIPPGSAKIFSIFVKEIQKNLIKKQFPMGYKFAVVGATGLVGQTIIKVIEELNLPVSELIPVASARSQGNTVRFRGKTIKVVDANTAISSQPKVAIFSAGASVSRELAPRFADAGIIVIDNSSAWRMDENVPLVVPEVNASQILKKHKIIANPNCSTIQMVVALYPLHKAFNLKRVIVSTYQSVTGSGMKGIGQLDKERRGEIAAGPYPYQIDLNVIPQGGSFEQNGYSQEELKLVYESRKILGIKDLSVTPTVVRVPVKGGHSESVTAQFAKDFEITNVRDIFSMHDGIRLMDDPFKEVYPMPLYSEGLDEVFVGRLRKDLFEKNTLNMWVVSDNLRKGAATNAVQIAQYIISQKHLAS